MTVAALVKALELVGQVYRNKDGTQPADAIKKVLHQFEGAGEITLAEWVEAKRKAPRAAEKKKTKVKAATDTPDAAIARFESAETQASLRDAIASATLSADQWKAIARRLTGHSAKSGKAAREAVETHFSDRLLLNERIESVKRQFG